MTLNAEPKPPKKKVRLVSLGPLSRTNECGADVVVSTPYTHGDWYIDHLPFPQGNYLQQVLEIGIRHDSTNCGWYFSA